MTHQVMQSRISQLAYFATVLALIFAEVRYVNAEEDKRYAVPHTAIGDKLLVFGALSGQDYERLPKDVAPEFRDPKNYNSSGEITSGWKSVIGAKNTCSSFAINEFNNPYYGGTQKGQPMFYTSPNCPDALKAFEANPTLNAQPVQRSGDNSLKCPENSYMIVPYAGSSWHVVRQLSTRQFSDISGPDGVLRLLYLESQVTGEITELTDPRDLPEEWPNTSGPLQRCKAMCISPGHPASSQPPAAPTLPKRVPPKPSPGLDEKLLAGTWTAITPDPNAKPVPYATGFRCGPFNLMVHVAIGVEPGWFGQLIPRAPSGPRAVALEIRSNLVDTTTAREQFGFDGVNLLFASTLGSGSGNDIVFREFRDALIRRKNFRTGAMVPQVVDPAGGLHFSIVSVDRNVMRVQIDWDSPCSKTLTFHRTRVMRSSPEIVR